ncbi:hypothetical protein, partial [Stenotrophomonas maltophilia]|uniref:hypothetical protein n=1 Tax=Stenotrophomonas maltophilia TaxID=40324 RepID=UPI001954A021
RSLANHENEKMHFLKRISYFICALTQFQESASDREPNKKPGPRPRLERDGCKMRAPVTARWSRKPRTALL